MPPHKGHSPQLREIFSVNEMPFKEYTECSRFENLTTIDPLDKFNLETDPNIIETRVIDLVTPIGKGTRGLIVAPPRTGKTTVLKQICNAVTTNHPEVKTIVMLIDERPEEVTDFERSDAEVVASSNDMDLETHVRLSRFMIERCRRMVNTGRCVYAARFRNASLALTTTSRVAVVAPYPAVWSYALEIPRRMFAAAQDIEGGSLTILATALVDTGSRMDELIFQEFKGMKHGANSGSQARRAPLVRYRYPRVAHARRRSCSRKCIWTPSELRRTMVDLGPSTRWRR